MTTYEPQTVTCANCGQTSEHQVLASTNAFGSPDLDLRPPEMRRSTMRFWVQKCPHCGYIASDISELTGDVALVTSPAYTELLNNQRYPRLAAQFLAHAILLDHSHPEQAVQSRLHAAWVCDDAEQLELARECRQRAAETLAARKPFEDSDHGVAQGAVLVDMLRRSEQFDQALSECHALLSMASAKDFLRLVLEYQCRLISKRDNSVHTLVDVEGDG